MLSLIRGEALAYLRLGTLAPRRRRVHKRPHGRAERGVVFVPGMGANGGNFLPMKRFLERDVDLFETFEYSALQDPRGLARRLQLRVQAISARCESLFCIGHSLGGVLLRLVLQTAKPPTVAGYAAICSPLHGTWRSRLAPKPLRLLTPDSDLMTQILQSAHRLDRLRGRILTVGARYDPFVSPHTSAFLDLGPQLMLQDVSHNGALLDRRVHQAVHDLVSSAVSSAVRVGAPTVKG